MMRSLAIVLALFLFAGGCGEKQPAGSIRAPRTTQVSEQEAIDIAKGAVSERDGWMPAGAEAEPMGNGWTVTLYRDGVGSGEVRLVVLDSEGNVIQYQEG
jgi:hypothetical protein